MIKGILAQPKKYVDCPVVSFFILLQEVTHGKYKIYL